MDLENIIKLASIIPKNDIPIIPKIDIPIISPTVDNSPNDNSQVKKNIVISDLQTDLDLEQIKSIANLLLYRETYPISSVLYEKIAGKYIRDSKIEEYNKFNIDEISVVIEKKISELNNNLNDKITKKNEKMLVASNRISEANIKKLETKEERNIVKQKQNWEFFLKIASASYEFIINYFPTFLKFIINNIGTFIHALFTVFMTKWTKVFAGFAIMVAIIILFTYLSSKNKSDNNKSSIKNSSTTENIFTLPDFQLKIDNMFAEFYSFTKRMSDNATLVSETISSVTTADPDDINRSKLPMGRGADNLYHFNGKDLNKMESKNSMYSENSVYSIYKPIDIKNKNFNIKWKSEKEQENSKYVFDCRDESMRDHFNGDCTVKRHDVIVSDKDNICSEPI